MAQVHAQATLMPKSRNKLAMWKAKTKCPLCNSPIAVPAEYDSKEAAFAALKEDFLNNHWKREHPGVNQPTLNF